MENSKSAGKISFFWLAGFWDGEGSIRLQSRKVNHGKKWFVPEISVYNTHYPTMLAISDFLKDHSICHHLEDQSRKFTIKMSRKHEYRIMIAGMKRGKTFLPEIIPYLITKKGQAEILLEFINYRQSVSQNTPYGEYEEKLRQRLVDLKR